MSAAKCETCDGSGMVAINPWGSRPQRKACDDCLGAGFIIAPRDARLDARMLSDLREWRRRLGIISKRPTVVITIEEFDLLLSIADDYDELKREMLDSDPDDPPPVPLPVSVTRPMPVVEISIEPDDEPRDVSTLPSCNCGSVDKYGDDLGEHSPRCPYHLEAVRRWGGLPA